MTSAAIVRGVALCAALVLAFARAVPAERLAAAPSMCAIKAVTGHECPGCGMTRALSALMHGDFQGAAAFNLGVFALAPLLLAAALGPLHPRWRQ